VDFQGFDKAYRVGMYMHYGDCVLLRDALRTHAGNGEVSSNEQDTCLYLAELFEVCAHVLDSSPAIVGGLAVKSNGNGKGFKVNLS